MERLRLTTHLPALLLLLVLFGCSGSQLNGTFSSVDGNAENSPTDVKDTSAGFKLNVLPESFFNGGSADIGITVAEEEEQVIVSLSAANAEALKALYFELDYDPARFRPVEVKPAALFGNPAELLQLTVAQEYGTVHHGQVLIHPQDKDGFSGSGVVAVARFARSADPASRLVSQVPSTDESAALLSFDEANSLLKWGFTSQGDYDQNSETNIADLTPLGIHFGVGGGPFEYYTIEAVVDGDGNGEINISDITPIGVNFGRRVNGYNVYQSQTPETDYPATNDAPDLVPLVFSVGYQDFQGQRGLERIFYTFDLTEAPQNTNYWVRPFDGQSVGTPSNIEEVPFITPPTPVVSVTASPDSGPAPLNVDFDASGTTSPAGVITDFEWDFDNDSVFNEADNGEDLAQGSATASFTFNSQGTFDVVVRATNEFGFSGLGGASVSVNPPLNVAPVADITGSPLSGKAPLQITFDASGSTDSDGSIVEYEWDFDGNGIFEQSTGTTPTVQHVFNTAGTFDVAVRVTDDDGSSDTASMSETGAGTITILPPNQAPTAAISADTTSGPSPLIVNFSAAASNDSDGTIEEYEWDFEGDGTFEFNSGSDATVQHTYNSSGDFDPAVRVTDNDGATDEASLSDTVSGGITVNTPPTADIAADVTSGSLPLQVNFDASGSTDVDGTIVNYQWDFEGDGIFEFDSGTNPTAMFIYNSGGSFDPAVKVTDDDGATDTESLSENGGSEILVNNPPTAAISADTLGGPTPLEVNFDASASTDTDGTVVNYEWDFEGDGIYDLDTDTTPTAQFFYNDAGDYDPTVRVTDNDGGTDTASLSENGSGELIVNDPPVAFISADVTNGPVPLEVNFDASSSTDVDGTIVNYEWDFEGDGIYDLDTDGTATASFTYNDEGNYDPTVRVTDDDGATDEASLSESGGGEINAGEDPPTADIQATPTSGDAPLVVDFDASGSTDDGTIVEYEWDFFNDGTFELSTGATPTVQYAYGQIGTHTATVRVTDDDSFTDTASIEITLESGWDSSTTLLEIAIDSKASIETFGDGDANARVGLAYKDAATDDLFFIRSTDDTGFNWDSPVTVLTSGQVGNDATLREINGFPGISFRRAASKLDYIHATAADGSTWPATSTEADGGGGAGAFTSLVEVNGRPAISNIKAGQDKLRYNRATNATGTAWGTPIDVEGGLGGGDEIEFTDIDLVNGRPAILFNFVGGSTGLKFTRATDTDGTSFNSSVTIDVPVAGGRYPSLQVVDSNPAASYQAFETDTLRYARASDVDGGAWNAPVVVDSGADIGEWTTLDIVGGLPVIAYYEPDGGNLKYAIGDDAQGTGFTPMYVDIEGDVGRFATMTVINDIPVIAYYDATNGALKIAVFVPPAP